LDRLDVSARCAEILVSSPLTNPFFANLARAGLGLMAVLHHDAASCAEHYANLDTVRGILIYFCISGDRLLGLLSHTMDNLDQASQHFEDALGFCRKAGYRPELAWTCCDYADTLLARHQPGDRQRAMSLLDECLRITRELGMRPLAERAATLQQQNQPRNLIPGYPDALSQREVEVLRLMALGKSNRDIADELVISLRTVVHHVTSILNKTGTANRTEATAYAARHGLISWSR
jgi:DNA-binding CsgD family transcriptional regulator